MKMAGQAIDVETRERADEELEWHAEGLGRLGTGRAVDTAFAAGPHTVELRLGDQTLASVTITAAKP